MSAAYLEAARKVAGPLADDLAADAIRAEAALAAALDSDADRVLAIGKHVADAGGKRLRPLFVALSARATRREYSPERAAAIGACMEMIHMATLIHDDVVDNADSRRGRPTACAIHGNTAGILTGDVLLARAMEILADDGDLEIIRMVSKAVVEMATGEVMEVDARGVYELDEARHLEILRRKTATFIAACCRSGGMIAGATPGVCEALASFGEAVGMGFQIADDLLDFRSDPSITGKPRATDFREGCATLPLIRLRPALSADEDAYVRSKFGNGVTEGDLDQIHGWMGDRGAYEQAGEAAQRYARQANEALLGMPQSVERDLLASLSELLVLRDA